MSFHFSPFWLWFISSSITILDLLVEDSTAFLSDWICALYCWHNQCSRCTCCWSSSETWPWMHSSRHELDATMVYAASFDSPFDSSAFESSNQAPEIYDSQESAHHAKKLTDSITLQYIKNEMHQSALPRRLLHRWAHLKLVNNT